MATRLLAKQSFADLHAAADRLEPELRRRLLAALAAATVDIAALEAALRQGRPIDDLLRVAFTTADLAAIGAALQAAAEPVATVTAAELGLRFDLVNPAAAAWATSHTAQLVTGIDATTQDAIRQIVVRGLIEGHPPRVQAQSISRLVGLLPAHAGAVDRLYRSTLEATSEAHAARVADRYAARLLRWRAENIARTETIRAANMGQQLIWDEAARSGLLPLTRRKVWIVTPDDRLCPQCAVLDGVTVDVGAAFMATEEATGFAVRSRRGEDRVDVTGTRPLRQPIVAVTPPLHPQCRCTVGLVVDGG